MSTVFHPSIFPQTVESTFRVFGKVFEKSTFNLRIEEFCYVLGIGDIIFADSRDTYQGEYVCSSNNWPGGWQDQRLHPCEDWKLNSLKLARLRSVLAIRKRPAILCTDPFILPHELGHHISYLANEMGFGHSPAFGESRLFAAFRRNGLSVHTESESEVMAETLGAYLEGEKLSQTLVSVCERVLSKLPKHMPKRSELFDGGR